MTALRPALAAPLIALLVATPAASQTVEDWTPPQDRAPLGRAYLSASVGAVAFASSSFELTGPDDLLEIETESGSGFSAAAGYAIQGFRFELQYADRRTDIEEVTASGLALQGGDGEVNLQAGYANVFYDFNHGGPGLSPFIGGGLGVARVETEAIVSGQTFFDESDTVFSGQFMAGLSLVLGTNAELYGQYTLYSTGRSRYDEDAIIVQDVGGVVIVQEGGRVPSDDYDITGHLFSAGVRFRF